MVVSSVTFLELGCLTSWRLQGLLGLQFGERSMFEGLEPGVYQVTEYSTGSVGPT
jgi:hypothetical protein